ncbi:T9SS type A sorting domain-containing protein [bacterium]|nr:T9SS type A sorting domain-containing protein [bacterium]
MKRSFGLAVLLALLTATVFAANFSPTVMTVTGPAVINYNFDGKPIDIPITLSGTKGSVMLLVHTKDQAANINMVRNGYLGWHRVNKIDTSVYVSPLKGMDIGANTITWNGKDQDGKIVPAGEYTYYLWGYDSFSARKLVTNSIDAAAWKNDRIVTHNWVTGEQLVKPVIHGAPDEWSTSGSEHTLVTRYRWEIGGDPMDKTLLETTSYWAYYDICKDVPSIYNKDDFFIFTTDDNLFGRIRKLAYVPNGESILDTKWGNNGEFIFSINTGPGWWVRMQSFEYAGQGLMVATNTDHQGVSTVAELVFADMEDGTEQFRIDLSEWWISIESGEKGGQQSAGPNRMDWKNNLLYLGSHSSCWKEVIDPNAGYEDEEEYMRWMNGNGDYTGDLNFLADANIPWVCNDYNSNPFMYQISADKNGFVCFPCYDMGAVSFGLMAPDGDGLGYLPFADEAAANKTDRGNIRFLTVGSAYDGFYCDNNVGSEDKDTAEYGTFYEACDSFKGIISNAPVAVEESAPAAFAVKQNSPNPFNPTTTISFSLAQAGNVTVDVFNAAGQKVDTIANEFMGTGSHSLTWDASGFSAGIYFYTVKTGEFSKTMKMTLLK